MSSDIVANHPGMVPGTNPANYLSDDVEFEIMEANTFKYEYGKPQTWSSSSIDDDTKIAWMVHENLQRVWEE